MVASQVDKHTLSLTKSNVTANWLDHKITLLEVPPSHLTMWTNHLPCQYIHLQHWHVYHVDDDYGYLNGDLPQHWPFLLEAKTSAKPPSKRSTCASTNCKNNEAVQDKGIHKYHQEFLIHPQEEGHWSMKSKTLPSHLMPGRQVWMMRKSALLGRVRLPSIKPPPLLLR
jgi:hypothetical protein